MAAERKSDTEMAYLEVSFSSRAHRDHLPGVRFPLASGHEIAGRIEVLGEGAQDRSWKVGDRVAIGWFGGVCGHCTPCR
ncbi:D-arabinose 1-dehydrogenase-like Zn-dependent alcohol dehydrogenase [Kitasatospora sp. GP82]|nr:D-arabinose 1-dehydrogenase-like Zn-dependent alcohol dehydrogenase [Kitasatospora sp. GP82]